MSLNLYLTLTSIFYDLDQVNHWSSQHPWLEKELSILQACKTQLPYLKKKYSSDRTQLKYKLLLIVII